MSRQFLIIDADDTLWENNIYFERAFDEFVAFLAHSSLSACEVRAVLDIPSDVKTWAMIPVGYPTGKWGEAKRRPVEEVAYWDSWKATKTR